LIQAAGYGTDTQSANAIDDALNAAWLEVASEREFSFLHARNTANSLTIGSEVTPLPSDIAVPKHIRLSTATESHTLQEVDARTVQDRLDADLPTTTGVPMEWAWVRQTVLVWPRPDKAYSVAFEYIKTPDPGDFDAAGEAFPFIDDRFAPVLAWAAIRWMAFRQRDQVFYGIAKQEYEQAKANLSASDRRGEQKHVAEWDGWSVLPGYQER
jgi:hypothetical protein